MAMILLAEQAVPPDYRLEKRLRELGYVVASVADGELVSSIKLHPYDAVIFSPEISGDERTRHFGRFGCFQMFHC